MNGNDTDKMGEEDHAIINNVTLKQIVPVRKVILHAGLVPPTNNGVRAAMAKGGIVDMTQDVNHAKPGITLTLLVLDLF